MNSEVDSTRSQTIEDEISELELRLRTAKARLRNVQRDQLITTLPAESLMSRPLSSDHFLLLLADSALPLGSFAFSSGLESYLAHSRPSSSFADFLAFSLASYASTTLPFVLAAHRHPTDLATLDDSIDAAIMCTVGRRASMAQGRALVSIWDRSFRPSVHSRCKESEFEALTSFASILRSNSSASVAATPEDFPVAAHLGPLFGAVACVLGISLKQTAYVFMLSHVKALLSAAVRASIFGPYQAQRILASVEVQDSIQKVIEREWNTKIEDAGQCLPVMDLWIGRHEMLYSRIFNS